MSQRRARTVARRRARIRSRHQDRANHRGHIERILGMLGFEGQFPRPSDELLDLFARLKNPKPRVVLDPGASRSIDLADLGERLQQSLDCVAIKIGQDDLTFNDFHSIVRMLDKVYLAASRDRKLKVHTRGPAEAVRDFVQRYETVLTEAYTTRILTILGGASGIDTAIHSARQRYTRVGDRTTLTLTLAETPVPSRTVVADGVGRRAYRCGGFDDLRSGAADWVEWDARSLGLEASERLPVYVQSHALHQIRHRLAIKPNDLIDYTLWRSLDAPVLIPGSGHTYLVEYRFFEHKLGYLVAERIGDLVLIRTFLLVTMQGTPEGSEFARRLRLRRPDIEYLGLDRLGTLVRTDLARDPEIAGLLRSCGCGGALDLGAKIVDGSIAEGYADRFRSYTGRRLGGLVP